MDPSTPVIAEQWLPKLGKELRQIVLRRRLELEALNETFRFDPEVLARCYVEPYVQFANPADGVGRSSLIRDRPAPLQLWLDRFLKTELRGPERHGQHVLFLLGDAGMGKTSALLMLKLWHLTSFWPQSLHMELLKLGPDTLSQIQKIQQKNKTVLLLDALDEDPEARKGINERLESLLQATDAFRNVVLTCRTQFFPQGGEAPMEGPGQVEVAGYVCNMLYLSPFFDDQVKKYLEKAFPNRGLWWLRHRLLSEDNPKLRRAKSLLGPMRDLRIRPLLLSYVDVLLENDQLETVGPSSSYKIFDVLVDQWLVREELKLRKQAAKGEKKLRVPSREELRRACRLLAYEMFRRNQQVLTGSEILDFLDRKELEGLSVLDLGGRSLLNRTAKLSPDGEVGFLFAHRTVQEFLAVEHMARRVGAGEEIEPVQATDEMVRFYFSAVRENEDFPNLTPLLRVEEVKDLVVLTWPEDAQSLPADRWRFPGLSFSNSNLRDRNLSGADLRRVSFAGADLRGVSFAGSDLSGADLSGTNLSGADLSEVDLSRAELEGANLLGANLLGANLEGVRWDEARSGDVPLDLFHWIDSELDGRVPLWKTIPAGEGWVGSPGDEEDRFSVEGPRHRIEVTRSFKLAAVPVTNAQYAVFDSEKGDSRKPNHPVANVSYEEASAFCEWLAKLPGFEGARLPTEEEWEYACRAGSTTRYWNGDTENDLAAVGWYDGNAGGSTHPVAEKPSNLWGLYDVHGNVWEWTASLWKGDYSGQAGGLSVDPTDSPADLAAASPRGDRVIRGGGYWDAARRARSAYRGGRRPGVRLVYLGFRVLRPFAPSDPYS